MTARRKTRNVFRMGCNSKIKIHSLTGAFCTSPPTLNQSSDCRVSQTIASKSEAAVQRHSVMSKSIDHKSAEMALFFSINFLNNRRISLYVQNSPVIELPSS